MNLIINCSSDRLQIWIGSTYIQLPNRGLEMDFPPQLTQWMQEYPITDISVINGPWSFTTLRVICLCINMYVSMNRGDRSIQLHHCTKTDLYNQLLPKLEISQIAIYIGQRNNMWLYDITTKTHSVIVKTSIDQSIPYDDVSDSYADDHDRLDISIESDNIIVTHQQQKASMWLSGVFVSVDVLHPHYLMQPNIQAS